MAARALAWLPALTVLIVAVSFQWEGTRPTAPGSAVPLAASISTDRAGRYTDQVGAYGVPLPGAERAKGNATEDPGVETRRAFQPGAQALRAARSLKLETIGTPTYFGETGRNSNLLTAEVHNLQTAALAALDARDHPGTSESIVAAAAAGRVRALGGSLSEAEMRAVLTVAGWPEELLAEALTVAYCESKWSPYAVGDGGHSLGAFQLNKDTWFTYAGEDPAQWADPLVNARVAWAAYNYDISRGYVPWKQWSCKP